MDKNEKQIIQCFKKDSEKAICLAIEQYGGAVKTICSHILQGGNRSLVEDAMQESFVRLWESMTTGGKIKKNFKGYLYQIARNCALDIRQREIKKGCLSTDAMDYEGIEEILGQQSVSLEDEFARRYNYAMVHETISEMEEPNRTIFLLKYFYYYTVREIAGVVHLSEDNVESRLRRQKKKLQEKLIERGVCYE